MLRIPIEKSFTIYDFSKDNFKNQLFNRIIHRSLIFGTIIFKPNSFLINEYRDRELSIDEIFELILEQYDQIKGIILSIRHETSIPQLFYLYIVTGYELKSIRNTNAHLAPDLSNELIDDIYYVVTCLPIIQFAENLRLIDITKAFRIKYNFKKFTISLLKADIKTLNTFDDIEQYDLSILNKTHQWYTLDINNLCNFLLLDIDNIKLIKLEDESLLNIKDIFLLPIKGSELRNMIRINSLFDNVDIIDDDFYLLLNNPYSEDKPILIYIQHPILEDNTIPITRIYHFPKSNFYDPIISTNCIICKKSKNYNNKNPDDIYHVITLYCGHTFHKRCIEEYNLSLHNTVCPICRNNSYRSTDFSSIHLGGSKMKYIKYKKKYLNL